MRNIKKFLVASLIPSVAGTMILLFSLNTCQKFNVDGFLYFVTDTVQSLGGGSYSLKGFIDDIGENPISEHGFCWSEQPNPTTNGSFTQEGERNSPGAISSTVSGLSLNTNYYYKAYMITSAGTEYANEKSFVTEAGQTAVVTSAVGGVTETTAEGGGNVISDGGATITARGVCWSTSQNPTTTDPKTTDAGTTGIYASLLTGLTCSTTYYVRAYAINQSGTEYGNQVQFTTSPCPVPPTVITSSVIGVAETTAQVGGNVTDDGGATITARGVCWNTTGNPTTLDFKTTDAGTIGSYESSLTGLSPFTTYYIKAYATNSAGTSYGSVYEIKTYWDNSMISDIDGNDYHTIQIGNQVWMTENMKTTRFQDGGVIQLVEDDAEWEAISMEEETYCWYFNDIDNKNTFGALYSYTAAVHGAGGSDANPSGIQGVCPDNWHLPSDAEWKELEINLGMNPGSTDGIGWRGTDQGGKLKSEGLTFWNDPNIGANNESGFSALPGGWRHTWGEYSDLGAWAVFWTTSEISSTEVWHRNLLNDHEDIYRNIYDKRGGFSVRCLKD